MTAMKRLLPVIALGFVSTAYSAGEPNEDLYVRPVTGEYGAENGTSYATAFDGKAGVLSSATPGTVGQLDAGDTLWICDPGTGFVDEAAISINDKSGAPGSPITLNGDCRANGDRSMAQWIGSSTGTTVGLRVLNSAYIDVKNLDITRTGAVGLQFDTSPTDYTLARNVNFTNVRVSWAGFGQAQTAGKNNFTLHGNGYTFTDVYSGYAMDDNLWIMGNNITLTRVVSEGSNFNDVAGYGDGLQCGGAGTGANCSNLVVTDSIFRESSHFKQAFNATSFSGQGGTPTGPALIENSEFYCPTNPVNSGSGCVTIWGYTNGTFRWNYVFGGTGVSMVNTSTNSSFYGNIITGGPSTWATATTANGMSIEGTGHSIYGNSISNVFRGISANGSGVLTRNNVVWNTRDFGVFSGGGGGGSVESGNYCYRCALESNSAFPNGIGAGSSTANPLLRSDYPVTREDFTPQASSPLCRGGVIASAGVTRAGRRFGSKPDIGAVECDLPHVQ